MPAKPKPPPDPCPFVAEARELVDRLRQYQSAIERALARPSEPTRVELPDGYIELTAHRRKP